MSGLILIRNADVYAPEVLGRKDVLIAGGKIQAIASSLEEPVGVECRIIDADGMKLMPGLIDGHVHIAGAGGDGGPATRTPEVQLKQLVLGGITTVIGCLGTDGITRSVGSLVMKAKAIRAQGLSAFVYTGSYQVPAPTLTGEVSSDLAYIEEIVGVGETAVADRRSSSPTVEELIKLAKATLVGGLLGGKAGVVHLHMGDSDNPFALIYEAVEKSDLPITRFYPTHVNRNPRILGDAVELGKLTAIDITAAVDPSEPLWGKEIRPVEAMRQLVEGGVPLDNITMTSDGCGSLPEFDENGHIIGAKIGEPSALYANMADIVRQDVLPLEKALKTVTENPARILRLKDKGRIAIGADADLLLAHDDLSLSWVVAAGQSWMENGEQVRKGSFE